MFCLKRSVKALSRWSGTFMYKTTHTVIIQPPRFYGVARFPIVFESVMSRTSQQAILMSPAYRTKSKKNRNKKDEESSDDEEDYEKNNAKEDDWTLSKDSKVLTLTVPSLRTDLILKAGLNMARNKVESLFYESKIKVNGKKLMKKSHQVFLGDEIDVVRGSSPDNPSRFIIVTRIVILDAVQKGDDKLSVRVRRFPQLTIEDESLQQPNQEHQ